jgi:hypothetical protein
MKTALLFGRASNNEEATARCLLALNAFWNIRTIGHVQHEVIAEMPFVVGGKHNYAWVRLGDNGGEINVEYINSGDTVSVPTTSNRCELTAETVAYRIAMTLKGEPVEYDYNDIPGVPIGGEPLTLLNC